MNGFPHLPVDGPREAPVLTTERLRLRPMTLGDWPAYRDAMTGERSRHMGGPYPLTSAWGFFCADQAGWQLVGAGGLTVDRSDGATVGQVVLNAIPAFPEPELGWMLYDGHEGRGYATEAAAALLDWAREHIAPPSLVSYVSDDNPGSLRVAERLGGARDEQADRPSPGDIVFRHIPNRPEASAP